MDYYLLIRESYLGCVVVARTVRPNSSCNYWSRDTAARAHGTDTAANDQQSYISHEYECACVFVCVCVFMTVCVAIYYKRKFSPFTGADIGFQRLKEIRIISAAQFNH